MNLKGLTKEKQLEIAKRLANEAGKNWNYLSQIEKDEWLIEASFCVSWLC